MNPVSGLRRITTRAFLTVAVLLLGAAQAQTAGASGLNDPIFPWMGNGGYDAQDYNIKLRLSADKRSESGVTTMQALASQELSQFDLDFGSLSVSNVNVNGAPARFSQADPELVIVPAQPIAQGQRFSVTVTYSGTPGSRANPSLFAEEFWLLAHNTLSVTSQPSGMFMWSPVNEHPSDKATFSLAITAAKADTIVVNGVQTGTTDNGDGTKTGSFRIGTPTTTYAVMFSVGQYALEEQGTVGDVRVRHYFAPNTSAAMRQAVLETPRMIDFFNQRLTPYPFPEVGAITLEGTLGYALETQSLISIPTSFGPYETAEYDTMIVAHELAHQWFADLVTYKTYTDVWLHEGFAQYLGELYAAQRYPGRYPSLEATLREAYPSAANGLYCQEITQTQLVGFLKSQFGQAALNAEQVNQALELIFSGSLPPAYRDQVLGRSPPTFAALADAIAALPFSSLILPVRAIYALRSLTGQRGQTPPDGWDAFTAPGALGPGVDIFNQGVYLRGAMALYALNSAIGEEAFWKLLRTYLERYRFGNASNADFINLTGELNGAAAKGLLERWVNDPQAPDLPELGLRAADFKPGARFK